MLERTDESSARSMVQRLRAANTKATADRLKKALVGLNGVILCDFLTMRADNGLKERQLGRKKNTGRSKHMYICKYGFHLSFLRCCVELPPFTS